jgi:CrcB protein
MFDGLGLAIGCGVGGMARVWVARRLGEPPPGGLPWNTLGINASGTFLLAALAGVLGGTGGGLWAMLGIGFLGSYTTVSSFSLQTVALLRSGRFATALANVALSLGLCLGSAAAGVALGQWAAP